CSTPAAVHHSFGQPRFPKTFNLQLRVCLSAPIHPRGYCEGGIEFQPTRRRLTRLGVASEMGESRRENEVNCREGGVLTQGLLPCDDGLLKATKLNKCQPHPGNYPGQ